MLCLHSDLFESLTYCPIACQCFFHALYLSSDTSNMTLVKSLSESINNFNIVWVDILFFSICCLQACLVSRKLYIVPLWVLHYNSITFHLSLLVNLIFLPGKP